MSRRMIGKHLVAIDIGTTKICVLVAQVDSSGGIDIVGMGHHPSRGLKKGVVVNIKQTVASIKAAIKQAEEMSGIEVEQAVVGISGGHISSLNSTGVVAIKHTDVTQDDVDRVIEAARAVPLPEDREILHILPQYFKIDGHEMIQDSVGMYGVRLEAQVHVITGSVASAQNIIKSCEMAGVQVTDIVLEQIASGEAVLMPSERELGVGIVDIGGGTSDFAIYKEGRIFHSKVLPIAGNHCTNDLAIGLGISIVQAEEFKRKFGFVREDLYLEFDQDNVMVECADEIKKKIDTYALYEVLEPRAREVFTMLVDEINEYRLRTFMPSGIVLTGGGSLLAGMPELAKECFGMKARVGYPTAKASDGKRGEVPDSIKSPIYSTGYGLLLYALKERDCSLIAGKREPLFSQVLKRMKSWVYDFL